ncbi:hypothetical protein SKAU_G00194080 [Synaphobranchus kaupii]|uniref:Uncharacterized protein n=1 Tax=Synaphobranchus kaupii TaxID=118154 RepID=A0A9Q1FE77_SYNKA|nr:hypothetical protein SKAU_G00194080 [Synaphobranchus kaupii]
MHYRCGNNRVASAASIKICDRQARLRDPSAEELNGRESRRLCGPLGQPRLLFNRGPSSLHRRSLLSRIRFKTPLLSRHRDRALGLVDLGKFTSSHDSRGVNYSTGAALPFEQTHIRSRRLMNSGALRPAALAAKS